MKKSILSDSEEEGLRLKASVVVFIVVVVVVVVVVVG